MSIKEYMPWIVVDQNGLFMVVRDSFCSPFGPRLCHRIESGKPEKYIDVRDAWEVAHRLNQEMYWGMDSWKKNRSNWLQTFTGLKIHPTDPEVEQICIEDIAHALSNTCRFNGHSEIYYSVAQHCVLGSHHCEDPLWFLLHDAAEAYLVDLPRPVKQCFPAFDRMEETLLKVIAERFGLSYPFPDCVHEIDNRMLQTERFFLVSEVVARWDIEGSVQPLDVQIDQWSPAFAERQFLERFSELTGQNVISRKTA